MRKLMLLIALVAGGLMVSSSSVAQADHCGRGGGYGYGGGGYYSGGYGVGYSGYGGGYPGYSMGYNAYPVYRSGFNIVIGSGYGGGFGGYRGGYGGGYGGWGHHHR